MEIIGLTGSIGMGKSATANMLRMMRIPVFDSDSCVHALLAEGGAAAEVVAARFPACRESGSRVINRQILGEIIFQDRGAKKALEDILHPMVWKAQREFVAKCRRAGHRKVVLDIPLLFETGSHRKCDRILCVTAPPFLQHQRVLSRPGMTRGKLSGILAGQLPDHEKRKLSHHVIPTGLGRSYTLQSLKKTLRLSAKGDEEQTP